MNEFLNEEWKWLVSKEGDACDYTGVYMVSNYGRVKSLHKNRELIMKPSYDKDGYHVYCIRLNGKKNTYREHRMVAEAFIQNPNHYPMVNHKDETRTNNHVSNLEWCDATYNNNYGTRNERVSIGKIGKNSGADNIYYNINPEDHWMARKVICLDTGEIFGTLLQASEKYNVTKQAIFNCCNGKSKTCRKLRWMYLDDFSDLENN